MCSEEIRAPIRGAAPGAPEGAPMIPEGERMCVWMQAGMLTYWLCDRQFRCEECTLDAALRHQRQHGALQVEAGAAGAPRTPERSTPSAFEGAAAHPQPASGIEALLALGLPALDPSARYHAAHTWARLEGPDRVRIGIDPFAAHVAGALRSVVLPHPGSRVNRGHPCAWLDQEGGTLTVLAPISGTIQECNVTAVASPDLVTRDPLGDGWLLCLQPAEADVQLPRLLDARTFRSRLLRDSETWRRKVRQAMRGTAAPAVGPTLADGGVRITDVGQLIGARRRHEIAAYFLSPSWARK